MNVAELEVRVRRTNPTLARWKGLIKLFQLVVKNEKKSTSSDRPRTLARRYDFLDHDPTEVSVLILCGHEPFVTSYSVAHPYDWDAEEEAFERLSFQQTEACRTLERSFRLQNFAYDPTAITRQPGSLWLTIDTHHRTMRHKTEDAAVHSIGETIVQLYVQYLWQTYRPFIVALGPRAKNLIDEYVIGKDRKQRVRAYESIVFLPLPYGMHTKLATCRLYCTPFLHMANLYTRQSNPERLLPFATNLQAGTCEKDGPQRARSRQHCVQMATSEEGRRVDMQNDPIEFRPLSLMHGERISEH